MHRSMPRTSALMSQRDYDTLRLKMDRFPAKLSRAREKYLRYISEASDISMEDKLSDLDRAVLQILNQEKNNGSLDSNSQG